MPLDPSIPLQARAPEQPNMLALYGQYQNLANGMAQNKLIQQNTANAELSNQTGQQSLATSRNSVLAQAALGIATQGDDQQTTENYQMLIDRYSKLGMIDPKTAQTWASNIPPNSTPADLRMMATKYALAVMSPQATMAATAPQQGPVLNTGAGLQPTTVQPQISPQGGINPQSGALFAAGGAVPLTLSPGQKIGRFGVMGANGVPGTTTVGSTSDPYGNALQPGVPPTPLGQPAQPGQPGQPGQQIPNLSPAGGGTPLQPSMPQQGANANGPGFMPTGLPIGQEQMIKTNQDAYAAAQADVPAGVQRIASLQKAYHALTLINSGPGTGTYNQIRSLISSLAAIPGLTSPNLSPDDTRANYSFADKYLQEYQNRISLGNTAAGINAVSKANPSTDINQGAAMDVTRVNIGAERMAQAQAQIANNPTSYLADASTFARSMDRRAFAADMYSPEQIQKMVSKMANSDEKAKFFKSLGVAQRMGYVTLQQPGEQQPPPPQPSLEQATGLPQTDN